LAERDRATNRHWRTIRVYGEQPPSISCPTSNRGEERVPLAGEHHVLVAI
jgi:hypothetical protein